MGVCLAVPVPQSPPTSRCDHHSPSYGRFSGQKQQIYKLAEARDPQEGSLANFKGSTLLGHLSIHTEWPKMPKIPGPHSMPESTPSPTSKCQGIFCFQAEFIFLVVPGDLFLFFWTKPCPSEAGCLAESLKKKSLIFNKRFLRNKCLCFLCKSMGGQGGHRGHRRSQGSQGV